MDAVSKKGEHAFSTDNKVSGAEVTAGGNKQGNESAGLNTAQTVADPNHVNSVWNKGSVGDTKFVDGVSYN